MSRDTAVHVDGVSKNFLLPHEKINSVKSFFVNPLRSRRAGRAQSHKALENIAFDVKKGEFFGIVGRNGSGKSTLLKIIAGIYQPTKGEVRVNGRLVPFIELGVGFNPELTGRDNVYLNGALMGFSEKEVDAMYDDIVQFAELEKFMDQKLKNYSSGMQVRLAFSVATRSKADILLIDEVLAVGDADFQRKCYQYFRSLKRQGTTVVFVSHDMAAVREYCDECVLIDDAKVLYKGSPEVAAEKYLKLFNHQDAAPQPEQAKNDDRWGDGEARFENVKVAVGKETISIKGVVTFAEELDDPIVGFTIKDSTGRALCGTNSKILREDTGKCLPGKKMEIVWELPNVFGDDTFTLETAITHRDGVTQADWWHHAASFTVQNDQSTPHPVSPKVSMTISK